MEERPDTIEVALTRGQVAVIDAADAPLVVPYKWQACPSRGNWYARRPVPVGGRQKYVQMHRVIMDAPAGMEVDHIDGDGLNNRRSNLRVCTRAQNAANVSMRRNNASGYRGVCYQPDCGLWRAGLAGRYLGLYDTAEEAARAYDTAARERNGEFAALNFPDEACNVPPRLGALPRGSTSGHRGVVRAERGRWAARVNDRGKRIHLGYFASIEDAVAARAAKLIELAAGDC